MITPLEVALTLLGVGFLTLLIRTYFDARDAWWKRVQWAVDKATSTTELDKLVGLAALVELTNRRVSLRPGDRRLMDAVTGPILLL